MLHLPRSLVYRSFALACGTFLAAGLILASIGPTLPLLAAHSRSNLAALGALFTALSAGVVLAQAGVGRATDRLGPRGVLAANMLLMGGGALGLTIAPHLLLVLAAALLLGTGFGGVLAAGNLLVARLFPARGTTALNALNLFFGLGAILGPALVGLAGTYLHAPLLAVWVGSGALLALAPLMLRWAVRLAPATRVPASSGGRPRQATIWLLGLLLLMYIGTEVGFGGWLTLYMMTSAALEAGVAALVASGFWLALTTGRALGAGLGFRLMPTTLLLLSLLGMLCGAALLGLSVGGMAGSVAGVLLFGLSCGPVFPTALALVATTTRGSGSAASLVLALGNSGGLIVPALLGLLLTQYGAPAMATLLVADSLTLVLVGTLIVRTGIVGRHTAS